MAQACRVGMLGLGTVGGAVAELLLRRRAEISQRAGILVDLRRVAVARPTRARPVAVPGDLIVGDARAVTDASDIDVVIEVIGGIEPARTYITAALASGKSVVTANKQLMASAAASCWRPRPPPTRISCSKRAWEAASRS